ncbi:hypothetical protein AXE65_10385 [Ventosimonas gracilis]|uniref:Uncharacterized protein n=1 Tax=Ventosimonas gracilis TaxID=1680762 RepID=A0A139SX15_9GAMM|nr:hypothetical protein AXE65_10385 [Ventosimonas gracilis]
MLQRRMAKFWAQPEGTGQIFRAAALLVAHLHEQTSLLAPCRAKNLPPSRPRLKREQPLEFKRDLKICHEPQLSAYSRWH